MHIHKHTKIKILAKWKSRPLAIIPLINCSLSLHEDAMQSIIFNKHFTETYSFHNMSMGKKTTDNKITVGSTNTYITTNTTNNNTSRNNIHSIELNFQHFQNGQLPSVPCRVCWLFMLHFLYNHISSIRISIYRINFLFLFCFVFFFLQMKVVLLCVCLYGSVPCRAFFVVFLKHSTVTIDEATQKKRTPVNKCVDACQWQLRI